MATQVDSLTRGSFKAFRPWRRRDAAGQAAQQDDGTDESVSSVSTALRQVTSVLKKERPPAPHTTRRRPRTQLLVSSPPSSASASRAAPQPSQRDVSDASRSPPEATTPDVDESDDSESAPGSSTAFPALLELAPPTPSLKLPVTPPFGVNNFPGLEDTSSSRPSLKRRRALSDVDGPNTATLSCKKRRLRRFLITSRLSQPFSQPATHIINRESVAAGDKRFLKLAAIMNAKRIVRLPSVPLQFSLSPSPGTGDSSSSSGSRRNDTGNTKHNTPVNSQGHQTPAMVPVMHPPCPNEVLRRAAMANRFRRRIYADAASGRSIAGAPMQLMTNARFTMVPVTAAASVTGETPATAATVAASAVFAAGQMTGTRLALKPASVKSPLAGDASPSQAQLMGRMVGFVRNAVPGSSMPIVRPISRSPKLRPVRDRAAIPDVCLQQDAASKNSPASQANEDWRESGNSNAAETGDCIDDEDDRECAFPSSKHESRYELNDDPEDVYSDFSVLFSSTGDDADWNEEGLDDYMDELDGIAHLPR